MASTKTVTASIVIEFDQGDAGGTLVLEVDSRADGLNGGNTSFAPGATPYLLLFRSSNVVIDKLAVSEGSLVVVGSDVAVPSDEWLTYANVVSANPKYPVSGGVITDSAGLVGTPAISEGAVSFLTPQIGVARLEYTAYATAYKLAGASGDRPVVIYVAGHTV